MTEKEKQDRRLAFWQGRFERALLVYSPELEAMDRRERLYHGTDEIEPMFSGDERSRTPLVRNVIAENIESCINPTIPSPKVTAEREEDAALAEMIENMLYCELERLPVEELNDIDERLCPIHGSSFYQVEWDGEAGRISLTQLTARMVIPQCAVTSSVEDMEYYFLRIPRTKGYIARVFGVDVSEECEQYPDIRGEGESSDEDMVSQIYAYYKNDRGGVGVISWVGDTLILDDEDYYRPKVRECGECGAHTHSEVCEYCGTKTKECAAEYEEYFTSIEVSGERIGGEYGGTEAPAPDLQGENGMAATVPEPVRVSVYTPGCFTLVQRHNISCYGSFLGESDVDKMQTQQNVLNRLSAKMLKKNLGGGTVLSLPDDADITVEDTDGGSLRIIRPRDAASAQLIRTFTLEGDISADMALYHEAYEEARQLVGVTDSLQGRRDEAAQSGAAKRSSAEQSQGRLESRRIMKKAAWAKIYELIFRLMLAYSRKSASPHTNELGEVEYTEFDRSAFLYRREDGTLGYNDRFVFSCDDTAPLGRDRSAMWSEAAANFSRGAYGNPASLDALLLLWEVLETFNYPSAGLVRESLERRAKRTEEGIGSGGEVSI